MLELDCYNNLFSELDISNNARLTLIVCSNNFFTDLDVTKNTALTFLDCDHNLLTALNVSNNTALIDLVCNNNQIDSLDVSKDTTLLYLICNDNSLISLDVSKDSSLQYLYCQNNNLAALDLSANTSLKRIMYYNNLFTFATMPVVTQTIDVYIPSPQKVIIIDDSLSVGSEIDLSSQLSVQGNITKYNWKTENNNEMIDGIDYNISKGKTLFLKVQNQKVYCELTNVLFPQFSGGNALKTSLTKIIGTDAVKDFASEEIMIFSSDNNLYVKLPYDAKLSIYDMRGILILSRNVYTGPNSVHLQNPGVYILKLNHNMGSTIRKVVIG